MADERGLFPSFKRTLTLTEPGDYLLRIMLEPKDGKAIAGMTHPVKVYKAPFQTGVAWTRSEGQDVSSASLCYRLTGSQSHVEVCGGRQTN